MGGKKVVTLDEAISSIDSLTPAEVAEQISKTKQAIAVSEANTASLQKKLAFLEKWQLAQS